MFKKLILLLILGVIPIILYAQKDYSTISGQVTDKQSGESIIGATVTLAKDQTSKPLKGVFTNKFGYYSMPKISNGKYYLTVSAVGYLQKKVLIEIDNAEDKTINIMLSSKDIKVGEVTVEAEKELPATQRIGVIKVDPSLINKMPSILGEIDVFRTLQLLPGVKSASEISSGLYVRGGSPDQNLILLDGVIVYNPSHLGGFFSVFNSDALKDIKLIKGGFPAEYGGRLSSVLDMTMKEGSKEKFQGEGLISMISSKLTLEGPLGKDASFMISGRRFYLDLLLNTFLNSDEQDEVPTYYFYDLNAKVNYKISENDHIFLSGFFARDVLTEPAEEDDNFDIVWGNATANLRWMHILSPNLFTNFSLIYTDYKFETGISSYDEWDSTTVSFNSLSHIKDFLLRAEAQYFPDEDHTIKTGLEFTNHGFISGAEASAGFGWEEFGLGKKKELNAVELSYYIQDDWKIDDNWNANIGTRMFYFNKGGYFNIEPRLSASYKIDENNSFKAAFSLANQYLHLIVRNDISLPTDLWFPSTETIKPAKSYQAMIGYESYLFDREYYFTCEAYYKDMRNLYEYKDSASFSFGIPLENQFTRGRGEAYGIELFLNKQIGDFTGWLGYTLSWTKRYFDELNNGKPFYPRYDRRHDVSFVLTYKLSENSEIGATWVYGTGQAYTMPTGSLEFNDDPYNNGSDYYSWYDEKYQYTERNGFRLPAFHKLDLSYMYKFQFFGLFPAKFHINIYNLYNQKNPFAWFIEYDYNYDNGEQVTKKVKQLTLFPIIPTIGLSFNF